MAMSVGKDESDEASISEINTTPLVDVMLVLLIIFLITVPVIKKMAEVEIPKAVNIPTQTKPENITISVNAAGKIFWNGRVASKTSRCFSRRSWRRHASRRSRNSTSVVTRAHAGKASAASSSTCSAAAS